MTGAMYAAVAGLKAHMSALNVIGNNISNVNTNAYKASRYTFLESLYTSVRNGSNGTNVAGGKNPSQIGYGGNLGTIDLDMSSKNFSPTGMDGDLMINGTGFFIAGNKDDVIQSSADLKNMKLTRLGNLGFDNSGYLVDGQGMVIYGYQCTEEVVAKPQVGADGKEILPTDTAYNWDEAETEVKYVGQPVLTAVRMPMMTTKECYVQTLENGATKVLSVEEYKALTDQKDIKMCVHKNVGDVIYPSFEVDTTKTPPTKELKDYEGEYASERALVDSISFDEKSGRITCTTMEGTVVVAGYIALAKVDNPNGVTHVDGHYYQALDGAGNVYATSLNNAVTNTPVPETPAGGGAAPATPTILGEMDKILNAGDTKFISGGLESSGTDLATEVSNMILIQRGYQANTRIVTVTDSMLEELVNMKR